MASFLSTSIGLTTGYTNVTVFQGDPVAANVRPSARISLESVELENYGFSQNYTTILINLAIETLYQPEATFLANLDPLINTIQTTASTVCGVEFCNVRKIAFSSEDAKYSRCIITVEANYYL